jgi:hypothetical protein
MLPLIDFGTAGVHQRNLPSRPEGCVQQMDVWFFDEERNQGREANVSSYGVLLLLLQRDGDSRLVTPEARLAF